MKLSVLQSSLRRKLATVKPAVAGKSSLPVLSNVLLTATDGGRLKIAATNLDVGITTYCGAKIEMEGAVTVPAQLLSDVVNSLPDDTVTLELDERTQTLNIKCGRTTANVKGIEADEFPVLPYVNGTPLVSFENAATLRTALDQVVFAAAQDDARPVLAGVLWRATFDGICLAAADGYRLAVKNLHAETSVQPTEKREEIIPAKSLQQVARVLSDDTPVDVVLTENQALFRCGDTEIVTRLVMGKFPDFERIIPAQHLTRAVVDTATFARDVKLTSYFAAASANIVKLTFDAQGAYAISANATEIGGNTSSGEAMVEGEGGTIALNVTFLQDALAACKSAQIAIETQTPQSPAVIKPVGDDNYIHICMPMAVR